VYVRYGVVCVAGHVVVAEVGKGRQAGREGAAGVAAVLQGGACGRAGVWCQQVGRCRGMARWQWWRVILPSSSFKA